jgi:hypothetical protein
MGQLEERQQRELNDLEVMWQSPVKVRHYNRSSPALRRLRVQQLGYLKAHEYEAMRRVQKEADELEEHETTEMMRLLLIDYMAALHQLQAIHADQVSKLESVQNQKVANFERDYRKKLEVIERRIAKLSRAYELTCDREALWNAQGHNQCDESHSTRSVRSSTPSSEVWSQGVFPDEFAFLRLDPVPRPQSVRRQIRRTSQT